MLATVLLDFRHAARSLRHARGFTFVAVAVLALGIGVNATVFSVVNALLLRPLPLVPEPERIAWVSRVLSYEESRRVAGAQHAFSSFASFTGISLNVSSQADEGEIVRGQVVTAGFFDVFAVRPAIGRALDESDVRGVRPVVVISDRLWRRRFDVTASPLGASLSVNGLPFTIVGVMPPGFIDEVGLPHDAWIPVTLQPRVSPGRADERSLLDDPASRWLNTAGRLNDGVSVADAERDVQSILYATLAPRFAGDADREATLLVMHGGLDPRDRRDAGPVGAILMALVGLVLLIACANVANLLLARGAERRREIAIRRALGASRARIVNQLLAESLLLSAAAGAGGVLLTLWIADLLRSVTVTPSLQLSLFTADLGPDRRVLAFTFAASVVSAVVAGLVPALRTSRPAILPALHYEVSHGYRRSRLRGFLVGTQVALSLALLVAAGLVVRSLQHVNAIDPGIDPRGRVLMPLDAGHYSEAQGRALFDRVLARVETNPRIRAAALARFPPLTQGGSGAWSVVVEGHEPPPGTDAPAFGVNIVTARYFDALAIPIVRGRGFGADDTAGAPPVAIVNESLARRYWPDDTAIGHRVKLADRWHTIVGVSRDGRYRTLGEAARGHLYLPLAQHYESAMTLVAWGDGGTASTIAALRAAVRDADSTLPVTSVQSYADAIDISYLPARAAAIALGVFGILALVLASAGVYAVMAYAVSRRTREIGVRVALGGQYGDVIRLVLRDGLRAVAIGATVGLALAGAIAPLARSALYGLSPIDPAAFGGALFVLMASAFTAAYVPARRAVRVDPAVALRED